MNNASERTSAPSLGEPAPFFEAPVGQALINLKDFRGKWLIVFSHPADVLPLFKTRTINYVLCKRKTKVVALGNGETQDDQDNRNFLKKYILKHSLMVLDDVEKKIAASYGLSSGRGQEEMKGAFIIDPSGILRGKLLFPLSAEVSFYEILKLRDALQEAGDQKARNRGGKAWKQRLGITILPRPRENN